MSGSVRKVPFKCPSCGFVQNEPEHLISTYCRSCGSHYAVQDHRATEALDATLAAARRAAGRPVRRVHCYRCGQDHEVSASARSTMCPGCQSSIELRDLVFSSNVSRPIDTRGKLTVEREAYLNSTYVICGEALVEGKINGTLRCENEVRLNCSGPLNCRITARSVVIERDANVDFVYPVTTEELIVFGRASGQFDCGGSLRICRRGRLEGKLTARSMVVDRGGILLAESSIRSRAEATPSKTADSSSHETGGLGFPLPVRHLLAG